MNEKIVVIGGGPGGYVASIRASQLGADVTLIEQDTVGGTCLNRGCIPSKIMKTTAEMLEHIRMAPEFGVDVEQRTTINLKRLMLRKNNIIETQIKAIHSLLSYNKVAFIKGRAHVNGYGKIEVKKKEGNKKNFDWDKLIIATGSKPLSMPAFDFDQERIISSNEALNLSEIPESVLIVGAGVIGCEFASILASWNVKVSVAEALDRMLPLQSVDKDCSKILQREMKKKKVRVILRRIVEKIDKSSKKLRVTLTGSPFISELKEKDKKPVTVEVDKVLVCIGRKANTKELGINSINVKIEDRGWIIANEKLETNVPGVYAIGDVLGPSKIMLAHVASREGIIAAENAMGEAKRMNYDIVPYAIFTIPEIANVGLTQSLAKKKGLNVRTDNVLFRTLSKAQVIGEIEGLAKVVSNLDTGKILGVHIIGARATELIAEGALAIQTGRTVKELAETIHAHPTLAEALLEVSFKALERPLHG
mmetsp:Transcript_22990/g.11108  ORF Transcript_22990/g.11108 Transcript_22990/m.11108 type:complete len:478 (-) Transcript_22990:1744-3177(-)